VPAAPEDEIEIQPGPHALGARIRGRARTERTSAVDITLEMRQVSRVPTRLAGGRWWERSPGAQIDSLDLRYRRFQRHRRLPEAAHPREWRDFEIPIPPNGLPSTSTARAAIEWRIGFAFGGSAGAVVEVPPPGRDAEPAETFPPVGSDTRAGWNVEVRGEGGVSAMPTPLPRGATLNVRFDVAAHAGALGRHLGRAARVAEIALQCEEETALGEGIEKTTWAPPDYSTQVVVDERVPADPRGQAELVVPEDAPYSFAGAIVAWRWRVAALGRRGRLLAATAITVTPGSAGRLGSS